jgi:hypothetical protein
MDFGYRPEAVKRCYTSSVQHSCLSSAEVTVNPGLPQLRDVDNSAGRSTVTKTTATRETVENLLSIYANCRWLKRVLDLSVTQNA